MRRPASKHVLTRRQFTLTGALTGVAAVCGCHSTSAKSWDFFSAAHARTVASLCDQIIPADEFPSASQAGVVTYIDRQLARHYRRHQNAYLEGLEQLDSLSRQRTGLAFADGPELQKLETAIAFERQNCVFFDLVRQHTMEGYYGSPRHGGNRDGVSWRMLGLDEPPLRGRAQYDLRSPAPSSKGGRS